MNWVIILAEGVVGVDILPLDWTLDGDSMAVVVQRLEDGSGTCLALTRASPAC